MTANARRHGPISAGELARLKKEKLLNDPSYAKQVEESEMTRRNYAEALHASQRAILDDLRSVNVDVDSVWDLVGSSSPYPAALPVLMAHLVNGGYPERVMEGLGRALAVPSSLTYWVQLKDAYVHARSGGEEIGAAVALAACATSAQLADLISLIGLKDRSESRVYFLRPVMSIGGSEGYRFIAGLREDPILGAEARALLKNH